jgi:tetratricopeptide (TPR) repeat protein
MTLRSQSERLQNLCDTMVQKRAWALMCQDADAASMSALETLDVVKANEPKARLAMAERLSGEIANSPEPFALWLTAEWIYWQMLTGQNLDQVEKRCWEMLGSEPPYIASEDAVMDELREIPLQRALAALLNLASRRTTRDESVKRLLAYIDRGIQKGDVTSAAWRQVKGDLLLALDRSDELVVNLRAWIAVGDADADLWRITLGHVLAEQGNLPEAISLLADLQQRHRLEAEDLWALSEWYLVEGQREKHTQARVESLAIRDEWKLRDALDQRINIWRPQRAEAVDARDPFGDPADSTPRSGSTEAGRTQVEDMDLQLFAALFIKSRSPETYLNQLQQAYGATRDFRLLNGLADAVMGQSAEKVYECLQNAGAVIAEVQEEATADSLVSHIKEVRARAVTEVDHLALDMLEVLIERRAAELQNQPGPHVTQALAALQRATQGDWLPGESLQMAGFLASLGQLPDQALADEQVRQLESLQRNAAVGTEEQVDISVKLAEVLWVYQRRNDATDLLRAVIGQCQQTHEGQLPTFVHASVDVYIRYLVDQNQFMRAEDELRGFAARPVHAGQACWFDEQLDQVYEQALARGGLVSLGEGKALFLPLVQGLKQKLLHSDLEHRSAAMERLISVYSTAKEAGCEAAVPELISFSREPLLVALKLRLGDYHDVVNSVASTLKEVAGNREMLAFLIWSLEHEPQWLANSTDNGWQSHSEAMADARADLADLGDLEQPLLAIVLRELRRDLLDRDFRIEDFFKNYHEHFWNEKRDDFLQTAQAVFAESRSAPDTQRFVAQYVAEGLDYYDTGIEMLLSQYQEGTLDYEWRLTLASWLNRCERFDESIPILQRLIVERPDDVDVACPLIRALSMTDRQDESRLVVQHVEASVRGTSRGKPSTLEDSLARLAEASWMSRLFDVAARLYAEVIALHKQAEPQRGSGDGVLSNYCAKLAESLAALGRTAEAIDAACEAVVSRGPQQQGRLAAIATLQQVLRKAADLPGYIAQLDRETQQTGQDKPIVRKALGVVLSERREWAAAIEQSKKAALLQPNDSDVWDKLTRCYDATGNKQAAVDALLHQLEVQPRELEICRDLAHRYDELEETAEAERALTTIVELLPQEAESHTMLAEIRQGQDRWADAAVHWQRVAKLRELEPTGLINLATIQIQLEQWQAARATLQQIKSRQWPERFDSVLEDVERLERELEGRG